MTAWPPLLGELVFRGTLSWWWVGTLIGLALIAVGFVYFRESVKLHPIQRIIMALFRITAIAAIVLLIKKPVLVSEEAATKPRPIAILVDNTQSMKQRDPRISDADIVRNGIARGIFAPDHAMTLTDEEIKKIPETDRLPTRADMVMASFQNTQLNLLDELRKKGPLQEYLFGTQIHGAGKDWMKSLEANESNTSLLYAIRQVLQRDNNELPVAIVVATDGLENDREHRIPWDEVGRECVRLKVPLHIYGVGGGVSRVLQLRSVESNPRDTLIAESSVDVTFRWTCKGIKDGDIELKVLLGGRVVAGKKVQVKEGDEIVEVLTFIPTKADANAGKIDLTGTINLVNGGPKEKDRLSQTVRVIERKVKVLYVEDTPRWEFKFLLRALQGDRIKGVEAHFVLLNGDQQMLLKDSKSFLPAFPKTKKELSAYDMIIIGDVDPNFRRKPDDPPFISAEQQKWIVEFVEGGGGLVMIAGRQKNPSAYAGKNPIGQILPVEFEAVRDDKKSVDSVLSDRKMSVVAFKPELAKFGDYVNPVMMLGDTPEENLKLWSADGLIGKIPWFWYYPVKGLKPGARSLLNHPTAEIDDPLVKDGKKPMPIIAQHTYRGGTVMFIGSDETWRWRFNEEDKYFARFWGQTMYQVGLSHLLGLKSQLDARGDFIKGKPKTVYARLFTEDRLPLISDNVVGKLVKVSGKTAPDKKDKDAFNPVDIVFKPVKGDEPGLYEATLANDQAGDFNLNVKVGQSLSGPTDLDLPIRVMLSPDEETAPGNLNETALKKLAEQTGGKYYRENDLKDLPGAIESKVIYLDPPPRKEILLWTRWYVLVSVVGLLTAEWLIRKFSNLS